MFTQINPADEITSTTYEKIRKAIKENDIKTLEELIQQEVDIWQDEDASFSEPYFHHLSHAAIKGQWDLISLFLKQLPSTQVPVDNLAGLLKYMLVYLIGSSTKDFNEKSNNANKIFNIANILIHYIKQIAKKQGLKGNLLNSADGTKFTFLEQAAIFANMPMFNLLLKSGANIYEINSLRNEGLLICACSSADTYDSNGRMPNFGNRKNRLSLVHWLLSKEMVDVNYISKDTNANGNGFTALMYAASGGYSPYEMDEDKDFTGHDYQVYDKQDDFAEFLKPCPELLRLLIQFGARIDTTSIYGTALIQATFCGFEDICRILLDNGADPTIRGREGLSDNYVPETAFEIARKSQNEGVKVLLEAEEIFRNAGFNPMEVCQKALDEYIWMYRFEPLARYNKEILMSLIRKELPNTILNKHIQARIIKSIEPVLLNWVSDVQCSNSNNNTNYLNAEYDYSTKKNYSAKIHLVQNHNIPSAVADIIFSYSAGNIDTLDVLNSMRSISRSNLASSNNATSQENSNLTQHVSAHLSKKIQGNINSVEVNNNNTNNNLVTDSNNYLPIENTLLQYQDTLIRDAKIPESVQISMAISESLADEIRQRSENQNIITPTASSVQPLLLSNDATNITRSNNNVENNETAVRLTREQLCDIQMAAIARRKKELWDKTSGM